MFCDLLKIRAVVMGHVLSACALLSSLTALVFVISQGVISNTQRIDAAIPTISYALEQGAKVCFVNDTNLPGDQHSRHCTSSQSVVLMSHLGRPNGSRSTDLSLRPVAECLEVQLAITTTTSMCAHQPLG